ncbi:hypothetical protein EDC04DRAFT_2904255 [Pisolithus marmoratus]|nr:hypothetical protein EDC04DRAFT_2904255 [Pisolithus marmoratus]
MHNNARSMVFKSKQFTLFIVIPKAQWRRYENYVNKLAEEVMATAEAECSISLHHPNLLSVPTSTLVTASSFNTSVAAHLLSYDIAMHEQTSQPLFLPTTSDDVGHTQSTLQKHSHQQSASMASTTTSLPPSKKSITMLSAFSTCRCDQVKQALQIGGAANVDVGHVLKTKLETIIFYLILTTCLEEILDGTHKCTFELNHEHSFSGQLRFNTSLDSLLGVGGFKTAHIAHLLLNPIAPSA